MIDLEEYAAEAGVWERLKDEEEVELVCLLGAAADRLHDADASSLSPEARAMVRARLEAVVEYADDYECEEGEDVFEHVETEGA